MRFAAVRTALLRLRQQDAHASVHAVKVKCVSYSRWPSLALTAALGL